MTGQVMDDMRVKREKKNQSDTEQVDDAFTF